MSFRTTLQKNAPFVILAALALLVLSATVIWRNRPGSGTQQQALRHQWFFDVGTGKLYIVDIDTAPPQVPESRATLADGSPGGVKAYVFSCGDCADPATHFVGYVATLPESERVKPAELRNPSAETIARVLVTNTAAVGLEWVPRNSEKAERIRMDLQGRCKEGQSLKECPPPEL